jgi:hypothetical protein
MGKSFEKGSDEGVVPGENGTMEVRGEKGKASSNVGGRNRAPDLVVMVKGVSLGVDGGLWGGVPFWM